MGYDRDGDRRLQLIPATWAFSPKQRLQIMTLTTKFPLGPTSMLLIWLFAFTSPSQIQLSSPPWPRWWLSSEDEPCSSWSSSRFSLIHAFSAARSAVCEEHSDEWSRSSFSCDAVSVASSVSSSFTRRSLRSRYARWEARFCARRR